MSNIAELYLIQKFYLIHTFNDAWSKVEIHNKQEYNGI